MENVLQNGLVYLIPLSFIYWCANEKKGLGLGIAMFFSIWLNIVLNHVPFLPAISLNAQTSFVVCFIVASLKKENVFYFIAVALSLLTAFAVFTLGGYSLPEIMAGWITGAAILCIYFLLGKRIEDLIAKGGIRAGMIAGAAVSFFMILYRPVTEVLMPGGMIIGLVAGFCLSKRMAEKLAAETGETLDSDTEQTIKIEQNTVSKYLLLSGRFLAGMAVLVLLFLATERLVTVFENSDNYDLVLFVRFALLSVWISAGAPRLFRLIRLADQA